jgi:hypothetical protein
MTDEGLERVLERGIKTQQVALVGMNTRYPRDLTDAEWLDRPHVVACRLCVSRSQAWLGD